MIVFLRVIIYTILACQIFISFCSAQDYFVHFTNGSDNNPGTIDLPLKHHPWMSDYTPLNDAPKSLLPGDIVYMARGQRWIKSTADEHLMIIRDNGTEYGGYIITTAYGSGDAPLLQLNVSGVNVINGFGDVAYIWFDNLHIRHFSSLSSAGSGSGIIILGDYQNRINAHHIKITNCEIDRIPGSAIHISNGHHIIIGDENSNQTATENTYSNHIHDFGYEGVALRGTDFVTKESWFYIYHNYIHDSDPNGLGAAHGYNAYGITTSTAYGALGFPNQVFIRYNRVENIPSWEGIDTHGASKWYCQYNHVYNCAKSIDVWTYRDEDFGSEDPVGPYYIDHNICCNDSDFFPVNFTFNPKPFVEIRAGSLDPMVQNVYFRNNVIYHTERPEFQIAKNAIVISYVRNLYIENNSIYNSTTGTNNSYGILSVNDEEGSLENINVSRNRIWNWDGTGIKTNTLALKNNCSLNYNLIQTSMWPLFLGDGLIKVNLEILNNTLIIGSNPQNEDAGLFMGEKANVDYGYSVKIANNVFFLLPISSKMYINWKYPGQLNGTKGFSNNLYYGSSSSTPFRIAGESQQLTWQSYSQKVDSSSINASPQFVDTDNQDFQLEGSSPCVDTGLDLNLTEDIEGRVVPQGLAPDIGAYEWSDVPLDSCPDDPNKIEPGTCGCGVADADTDGDGVVDCLDGCPNDRYKTSQGICGCGVPDRDSDNDGLFDCEDGCPENPDKVDPGVCGCEEDDTDSDQDGTLDCQDGCPNDENKATPGVCGCGIDDTDRDNDGLADCEDECPNDPYKVTPGKCGCGEDDVDSDRDGILDCEDGCENDTNKDSPGVCGCGVADTDSDGDGIADCDDISSNDPNKNEGNSSGGGCFIGTSLSWQ